MLAMCSGGLKLRMCCWRLSIFHGPVVTPAGAGEYCSVGIEHVSTARRGRRRGGGGGCSTTITLKVLSFQNKSIYLLYTLTVTYKLKIARQLSLFYSF